jgi:flavin-binding protein dodecin
MSQVKVIELLSSSPKSWTDATELAIKKASKSLRNIRSANVQNMGVTVENGKIKEYRVNVKLTFGLE